MLRHNEVHVVNTSKGLNLLIKVVLPLISSFMKNLIYFHFNDYESLAKVVGKDVLPPFLGGNGPPVDFDKAITDMYKRLEEHHQRCKSVDESTIF